MSEITEHEQKKQKTKTVRVWLSENSPVFVFEKATKVSNHNNEKVLTVFRGDDLIAGFKNYSHFTINNEE